MSRDSEIMRRMGERASELLPRPPGIIIPGWFWQEWALAASVVITTAVVIIALSAI